MLEGGVTRSSGSSTMVLEGRPPEGAALRPKRTFSDEVYSTFSSPLAWVLVVALLVTWTCVFVILFDLSTFTLNIPLLLSLLLSTGAVESPSDPLRLVKGAAEGSLNFVSTILRFAAGLVAPDDEDGTNRYTHTHTRSLHTCTYTHAAYTSVNTHLYIYTHTYTLSRTRLRSGLTVSGLLQETCTQYVKKVSLHLSCFVAVCCWVQTDLASVALQLPSVLSLNI
uniref:Uncharacterized protein n=1 Tax=Periophthalmus magnuspinnatus TaxID=409849 RepID=A0A3B4AL82_9GOBI